MSRGPRIRVWTRQNTTEALGDRCRFTRGHHKDKQGDNNNEFRSAMHHTTTQHESTFCSGSRRLPTLQTVDTPHSNPPPLEIRVFKVECTTEIPLSTRLKRTLYRRIDKRRENGVSKGPLKRRMEKHHEIPIYRQCERLVRGFNRLRQEAFQIENPLFIAIR